MLDKLKSFFNHERYQVIAFAVTFAITIWLYGCPSKVPSLSTPSILVTRDQLQIELDTLLASAQAKFAALDKQDEFKQTLFESALVWARTGSLNPIGIITAMAAIAGVGATVDNVRKRREIKALSANANAKTKTDQPDG